MFKESRTKTRFKTKKMALVAFFSPGENDFFMLGDLVDMNENGLGVCYIDREKRCSESMQISIFGVEKVGFVSRVPCRIVYDVAIPGTYSSNQGIRRCGIRFEELSRSRIEQLKQFVKSMK